MTTTTGLRAAAAAALLGLTASMPAPAKIVCWTNSEGVRECGNAVPPEYAQQSIEHKSRMGITVEKIDRAKTPEELAAERAERAREREAELERERQAAAAARRDQVLLRTFTTEEDLKLTRDGKLAAIDSRIKHSEQVLTKLEANRADLEGEAASLERSGKKVPEDLRRQIEDTQAQIDKTLREIRQREQERILVQDQFNADLTRYRELKGG